MGHSATPAVYEIRSTVDVSARDAFEQWEGAAAVVGQFFRGVAPLQTLSKQTVLAFIRRNYTNPELTAEQIARACMVSPRSLYRLFEDTEHGIGARLMRMRLDHARKLLRTHPFRSLASVAAASGFASETHTEGAAIVPRSTFFHSVVTLVRCMRSMAAVSTKRTHRGLGKGLRSRCFQCSAHGSVQQGQRPTVTSGEGTHTGPSCRQRSSAS
ncbi:helix-turn-helix domain-containing protein [Nocardia colli]|uniref:Helix-turn-helix domain-containing protein n=1 Tax=Nocardia colli TaxID=2545717 RepID=A0A5N0EGM5_9NOCA|nr:helix-turn-helix domain-containing protein [Nocardia colli]KAA8888538.1 helix-turn-helix domain-containing protein [Nocardia colli]